MKILIIYNLFAANKSSVKYKDVLLEELNKAGIEYELSHTGSAEEAAETVKNAEFNKYAAIAAAGGDGTIFNVLNGYFKNNSPNKIPLAVIPLGTGNAFARDLGIESKDIKSAVNSIKNGHTQRADIGKFKSEGNEYYFANIIGMGFVTDVARTAHGFKKLGGLSYTLGVLYHTLYLKSFDVTISYDGSEINRSVSFIEISNTRYTGKDFLMAPAASINDGLFDITIMNKATRRRLLSGLPKIFKGNHIYMDEVESIQARSIKISASSPKILTPDGEILGSTPLEIECIPEALEVFVNKD